MRGSHTPLLPLQALSQPSNMGSRTIGACSQVFRFTFFNTPLLPWLIRPTSLMSHSSLGLNLLPIPVPVARRPTRERLDSEITLSPPAVLTDCVPSLSTPSVFLVCFDAVSWRSLPLWLPRRYHPPCYIISAYLPGLHSARPLAFVEGDGFEPP